MDILEEMDKFLETYNLLKLNQEELENLNRPITMNEIEAIIKKLPANKSVKPDSFTCKFHQTFKEELKSMLLKLLQKKLKRKTFKLFYKTSINRIPKSR